MATRYGSAPCAVASAKTNVDIVFLWNLPCTTVVRKRIWDVHCGTARWWSGPAFRTEMIDAHRCDVCGHFRRFTAIQTAMDCQCGDLELTGDNLRRIFVNIAKMRTRYGRCMC